MYRGSTPNANARHYTVSAARSQYSQYCIKIHLDCIAVAIHFILLKSRVGLPYSFIFVKNSDRQPEISLTHLAQPDFCPFKGLF